MTIEYVKTSEIKENDENPRYISEDKFSKLKKSIKEFPDMLEKRPLIVDENMIVLGGNMRLKALKELGHKEIPIIRAIGWSEDQKKEFIIKDNLGFGSWDWDMLANEWDVEKLEDWGLNIPNMDHSNFDLDSFFEENDSEKEEKFKIILEYSEEDFNKVNEALKKYSGSKESIFSKLLGL